MNGRTVKARYEGDRYEIPECWLVGRIRARELADTSARAIDAVADWAEQVDLQREATGTTARCSCGFLPGTDAELFEHIDREEHTL